MEQGRRDVFKKIGILGATALAMVGVSKRAKADEGWSSNPLLGLWDMTIPPAGGSPTIYYKYAISEGAYVCTGNEDSNAPFNGGYEYSPTMGTYTRTSFFTFRLRERTWAFDSSGNPAGSADFKGTATVATDGKTFAGSGTLNQYDLNGNVVFTIADFTYTAVKFPA